MTTSIKDKSYLYHLTSMDNLESILKNGLLPRSIARPTTDVADKDILQGREAYNLHTMVPFHFFANNPFDGRVQLNHRTKNFLFIAIDRAYAKENNWKISPKHPLNANGAFNLLDYDEGMKAIEWEKMDTRNYTNPEIKCICMAECLSPTTVDASHFSRIFVKTQEQNTAVVTLLAKYKISSCQSSANPFMFIR